MNRVLCFAVAILAAPPTAATSPCVNIFQDLSPLVSPADLSTDLPQNTSPILHLDDGNAGSITLLVNGAPVLFHEQILFLQNGFSENDRLVRVIPDAPLAPGATVEVEVARARLGGFGVGEGVDEDAPEAPAAEGTGPFSDGACPPYGEIQVQLPSDAVIAIANLGEGNPSFESGDVTAASVDESLVVSGPSGLTRPVGVAAVDVAGNISRTVTVDLEFACDLDPQSDDGCPAAPFGCVSGPPPSEMLLPLAILMLRRRRHSKAALARAPSRLW